MRLHVGEHHRGGGEQPTLSSEPFAEETAGDMALSRACITGAGLGRRAARLIEEPVAVVDTVLAVLDKGCWQQCRREVYQSPNWLAAQICSATDVRMGDS